MPFRVATYERAINDLMGGESRNNHLSATDKF